MIKNHIKTIKGEVDVEIKGQEEIKREAYQHFKCFLSADLGNPNYEDFIRHIPKLILEETNLVITKEVEEDELQLSIWNIQ